MDTTKPVTDPQPPRQPDRGQWALPVVLAVAIAVCTLLLVVVREKPAERAEDQPAAESSGEAWSPPVSPDVQTASLVIDFGNGARRSFELPCSAAMTVGDLLRQARDFRPGLKFTQQGVGELAMLTSLEGVANGTAGGRFWLYEVNGKHAEVSFAVKPLTPGDRVLWVFKQPE